MIIQIIDLIIPVIFPLNKPYLLKNQGIIPYRYYTPKIAYCKTFYPHTKFRQTKNITLYNGNPNKVILIRGWQIWCGVLPPDAFINDSGTLNSFFIQAIFTVNHYFNLEFLENFRIQRFKFIMIGHQNKRLRIF